MSMKTLAVLGETWQTDQSDLLEFATANAVPRQGSWKLQLRRDLRSWFMWLLLAAVIGFLILGILEEQVWLVLPSLWICFTVGRMFVSVSKGHSTSPLLRGVVSDLGSLQRHPLLLGHVTKATLMSQGLGHEANVGFTNSQAVNLLQQAGRLEILVLFDPKAEYSSVIGWRVPA